MSTLTQFFYSAGGGTGATNVQVFTASGTFTPPAGVTQVCVTMCGGGGGGKAGFSGPNGTTGGSSTFGALTATGGTGGTAASIGGSGGTGTIPGGVGSQYSGGVIVGAGSSLTATSAATIIDSGTGFVYLAGGSGLGAGTAAGNSTPNTGAGGGGGGAGGGAAGGGGGIIYRQVVSVAGPVSVTIGAGGLGYIFSTLAPVQNGASGICIVEW